MSASPIAARTPNAPPKRQIAFIADVEGNLDYFQRWVDISQVVKWTDKAKSELDFKNEDDEFVFGGDSQDKGMGDIRFVRLLLVFKDKYPDRVHWIVGNRDCNKLRLAAELSDEAIEDLEVQNDKSFPYWVAENNRVTPQEFLDVLNKPEGSIEHKHSKANRLRWMLKHTMGADGAFERRKLELDVLNQTEGVVSEVTDGDVVNSFVNEVNPSANDHDRFMLRYLEKGKLAHTFGKVLFVHGALTEKNILDVPGTEGTCDKIGTWVERLNSWATNQVEAFKKNPTAGKNGTSRAGHGLMDYGVPEGNHGRSVICASWLENGNSAPVNDKVVKILKENDVSLVVTGHIPHGDCPNVICAESVTVVSADTSYSHNGHASDWGVDNRGKAVSEVLIHEDGSVRVHGFLRDGAEIDYEVPPPPAAAGDEDSREVGRQVGNGHMYHLEKLSPMSSAPTLWTKAKYKGSEDFLICRAKGRELQELRCSPGKMRWYNKDLPKDCPVKEACVDAVEAGEEVTPSVQEGMLGRLKWKSQLDEAPRPFFRVPVGDGVAEKMSPKIDPKILRFVLEHVWGLTRPNVLLTVTGGAQDFDLDAENKDELLQGLTDTAKSVGAWFTTGGTAAGIMKYMGLARLLYANEIPLVGIASYGIVKGKAALDKSGATGLSVDYEQACRECRLKPSVPLDVNHSHFLFAENGTKGFGQEFLLRSELEAALCDEDPMSAQINAQWKGSWEELGVKGVEKRARETKGIPAVCICVQGGPGTIETVRSSVMSGTPVLLVKGSGKAADLIADVVLVKANAYRGDEGHGKRLKEALEVVKAGEQEQEEKVKKMADKLSRQEKELKEHFDAKTEDCEEIFKHYGMQIEKNLPKLVSIVALVEAMPKGFAVYDLEASHGKKGDLKGALLRCILEWQDHEKQNKHEERVRSKTLLAVQWDKPDALSELLSRERKRLGDRSLDLEGYMRVVGDGLLEALCSGNERCVQRLLEQGADLTQFGVDRKYLRGALAGALAGALDPGVKGDKADKVELARACRQALQWKILIRSCSASHKTQHVVQMLDELKDELKEKDGGGQTIVKKKVGETGRYTYNELREKKAQLGKVNWKNTLYHRDLHMLPGQELANLFFGAVDSLSRMDLLYRNLLGPDWAYTAGCLGKPWDLFLALVLMNKHDIAKICWGKLDQPVRAALLASKLYREMAKKPFLRKEVSLEMKENADDFEKIAARVVMLAMEEDMDQAIESLETRVGFLGGNTIFDLAIDSESKEFVTTCCKQATDRRFYGDIDDRQPQWMPEWLPLPSWVVILLCVFTLGFAAPRFVEFRLPPPVEACRGPSQRRPIPKGYPNKPKENEMLIPNKKTEENKEKKPEEKDSTVGGHNKMKLTALQKLDKDENRISNFSEKQLAEVWSPTFTYWDRWWCFVQAPIVHFQVRAVIYTSLVFYFTATVTNVHVILGDQKHNEGQSQELKGHLYWVWWYMFGSAFIEIRQLQMNGAMDYIGDSWNCIDITTIVSFFLGFYLRKCYELFTPVTSVLFGPPPRHWPVPGADNFLAELLDDRQKVYCICLFFCWLRLLHLYSVNKTLGTLVRAILIMVSDITTFICIWGFFLMAFAAAMFAGDASRPSAAVCAAGDVCENLDHSVKSWRTWWILRTYFQAYGEMDLDGLNDWVTVSIFMVLLLVLQLVLNNTVFVAVLTAKFEDVIQESETAWMFEMHDISEEFMQHPCPSPFNLLWMLFEAVCFLHDEKTVQKLLRREEALCMVDGKDDCATRWWHLHLRLRHPRYHDAPLLPRELDAEPVNEEDELQRQREKEKDARVRRVSVCPEIAPEEGALVTLSEPYLVTLSKPYRWAVEQATASKEAKGAGADETHREEASYRNGEVLRRDRALLMRAKARYLEEREGDAVMTNQDLLSQLTKQTEELQTQLLEQRELMAKQAKEFQHYLQRGLTAPTNQGDRPWDASQIVSWVAGGQ